MIKICSLDFLNREKFGTDVMTADGTVLFHSDDKITPEIILRLYFKEIYAEESFLKEEPKVAVKNIEASVIAVSTGEETVSNLSSVEINIEEAELESVDISVIEDEKITSSDPRVVETNIKEEEKTLSGPKSVDVSIVKEEKITSSGPRSIDVSAIEKEETTASSGPRSVEANVKEEKASLGPRSVDVSVKEEETTTSSGPRVVETRPDISEEDQKGKEPLFSTKSAAKDTEIEKLNKNPEEEPLIFDEEQAKRIVEHSIKIGKLLNFSTNEIKELEQVAYYCNIGITKFKKADLSKKSFRKMKTFASYEKLLNEGVVPEEIAEVVKLCANDYESDTFPLNSKIPYHHIVALTSFYEESLAQNNSKLETLLKMLQMGGNQFNIFILHKFIKIMREANV